MPHHILNDIAAAIDLATCLYAWYHLVKTERKARKIAPPFRQMFQRHMLKWNLILLFGSFLCLSMAVLNIRYIP